MQAGTGIEEDDLVGRAKLKGGCVAAMATGVRVRRRNGAANTPKTYAQRLPTLPRCNCPCRATAGAVCSYLPVKPTPTRTTLTMAPKGGTTCPG